jgi:AcrR family transcriptional regulator
MLSSTPCVSRIRWTELFVERGYVGTSLLAVAGAAGVAPRTVYVRFRSKAQLLSRCIVVSIVGDQEPVALRDREWARTSREAPTLDARIEAFVAVSSAIMGRSAALFTVASQAAAVAPEIAAMERAAMQHTVADLRAFAEALAADGMLPAGVTPDAVTDLVWVVAGPRTMVGLRGDRGWTTTQYAAFVRSTLLRLLVQP